MHKHPLRKFLGLTVLYAIVIVGIFVIQFKTESVISKSLGNLKFSISQTQNSKNETILKNRINVSFMGLSFNADEKNPAWGLAPDGSRTTLELSECQDNNENMVRFSFAQGGFLEFYGTDNEENGTNFFIAAKIPDGYSSISLPYRISQQYSTENISGSQLLLTSKNDTYNFTAADFDDDRIIFSTSENMAKFSPYEAVKHFEFDQVNGFEGTTRAAFERMCERLKNTLVAKVQAALESQNIDSLGELDITAYVAELASQGKYNQAIDSVPDSFKKGNKRSYISSPFFDNLSVMYRSLSIQDEKYASMVASKTLDVFTADGITDYILREKKSLAVKNLLSIVLNPGFAPTAFQAGGILGIYSVLNEKEKSLAAILEPSLEACVEKIQKCCTFDNGILSITEEDGTPLSTEQAVILGNSLVKYALIKGNETLEQAGYIAAFSALNKSEPELRTISAIYHILAPKNTYFPHTEILGWFNNTCVWAWTCAKSIDYVYKPESTANIVIDFPIGLTHYVIFNGVPDFRGKIEIQRQMFRTDPRFETYNSSGYVYQASNKALLIKSRHKSKVELIRLFYEAPASFTTTGSVSRIPAIPVAEPKPEPKKEPASEPETEAVPQAEVQPQPEPAAAE